MNKRKHSCTFNLPPPIVTTTKEIRRGGPNFRRLGRPVKYGPKTDLATRSDDRTLALANKLINRSRKRITPYHLFHTEGKLVANPDDDEKYVEKFLNDTQGYLGSGLVTLNCNNMNIIRDYVGLGNHCTPLRLCNFLRNVEHNISRHIQEDRPKTEGSTKKYCQMLYLRGKILRRMMKYPSLHRSVIGDSDEEDKIFASDCEFDHKKPRLQSQEEYVRNALDNDSLFGDDDSTLDEDSSSDSEDQDIVEAHNKFITKEILLTKDLETLPVEVWDRINKFDEVAEGYDWNTNLHILKSMICVYKVPIAHIYDTVPGSQFSKLFGVGDYTLKQALRARPDWFKDYLPIESVKTFDYNALVAKCKELSKFVGNNLLDSSDTVLSIIDILASIDLFSRVGFTLSWCWIFLNQLYKIINRLMPQSFKDCCTSLIPVLASLMPEKVSETLEPTGELQGMEDMALWSSKISGAFEKAAAHREEFYKFVYVAGTMPVLSLLGFDSIATKLLDPSIYNKFKSSSAVKEDGFMLVANIFKFTERVLFAAHMNDFSRIFDPLDAGTITDRYHKMLNMSTDDPNYLKTMDDLLADLAFLIKKSRTMNMEVREFSNYKLLLEQKKANMIFAQANSKTRWKPFSIKIAGEPGVGKTDLSYIVTKIAAQAQDIKLEDEDFYVRSDEPYWSNFTSKKLANIFDDVGQKRTDNDREAALRIDEIRQACSSNPMIPPQAEAHLKGKTPFLCKYVVVTTNDLNDSYTSVLISKDAYLRRFEICLRVHYVGDGEYNPELPRQGDYSQWMFDLSAYRMISGKIQRVSFRRGDDGEFRQICTDEVLTFDYQELSEIVQKLAREHKQRNGGFAESIPLRFNECGCVQTTTRCKHGNGLIFFGPEPRPQPDEPPPLPPAERLARRRVNYLREEDLDEEQLEMLANLTLDEAQFLAPRYRGVVMARYPQFARVLQAGWSEYYYDILTSRAAKFGQDVFKKAVTPIVDRARSTPAKDKIKIVDQNTFNLSLSKIMGGILVLFAAIKKIASFQSGVPPRPNAQNTVWDFDTSDHIPTHLSGWSSPKHVRKMIDRNVIRIEFDDGTVQHALGICDKIMVINKHIMVRFTKPRKVHIYYPGRPHIKDLDVDIGIPVTLSQKNFYAPDDKKDIAFLKINSLYKFKDISDKFTIDGGSGAFVSYLWNRSAEAFHAHACDSTPLSEVAFKTKFRGDENYACHEYIGYRPTVMGDCGSPIFFAKDKTFTIRGIHMGADDKISYMAPVSTIDVENAKTYFNVQYLDAGEGFPIVDIIDKDGLTLGELHPRANANWQTGNGCVSGSIKKNGRDPPGKKMSSNVQPTPVNAVIVDAYGDLTYEKPKMDSRSFGTANGFSLNPQVQICDSDIDVVVDEFKKRIDKAQENGDLDFHDVRMVSLQEALRGQNGVPFLNPLNMSTSAGFPLSGQKKDHIKAIHSVGDNFQIELNDDTLDKVATMQKQLEEGIKPAVFFSDALKDEPIKKAKNDINKVRVFSASPMIFTICCRMYFMRLLALIMNSPGFFSIGIGHDTRSPFWGNLKDYITYFGEDRCFDVDFQHFDKQMAINAMRGAWEWMLHMLERSGNYGSRQMKACHTIVEVLIHAVHIQNFNIMEFYCGNPSGHFATLIINSFVNMIYMMIVFKQLYPRKLFHDHVRLTTCGDDNVNNVSEETPEYNFIKLQEILAGMGIGVTMADKSDKAVMYKNIYDVEFLKRSFEIQDYEGMKIVASPLAKNSIIKMLSVWVKSKRVSEQSQLESSINSAMLEMAQHPESDYYKLQDLLKVWYINSDYELPMILKLSYEQLRKPLFRKWNK